MVNEKTTTIGSSEGTVGDGLFIASLAKGIRVLECFDRNKRSLSLSEIAVASGIGKSAAQRAVYTLHALGYLRRDDHGRSYRLAPKVMALSRAYVASSDLVEAALPFIRQCNDSTGETVNLTELDGTDVVYLARAPGRHIVTIEISVGSRLPAYCVGPGLAMLAFSDPDKAKDILDRSDIRAHTANTVTDRAALSRWLDRIRIDGYVIADQLMFEGEHSIAAPVIGPDGKAIAAVNISTPASRSTLHDLQTKLVPAVIETARQISMKMGG